MPHVCGTMPVDELAGPTPGDIRGYLLSQLGLALRRPGMYGNEIAHRLYLDAVAFAHGQEQALDDEMAALRSRKAFNSLGVTGAVESILGFTASDVMTSVYVEIAHRYAWLVLDRTLSPDEYDHIRRAVVPWCGQDRSKSDVLARFGPPSMVVGGSNPYFPKTIAYGSADLGSPLVFFHLWNGSIPGEPETWPPPYPEPQLLAARCDGATFVEGFTFTPLGVRLRRLAT